MLLSGDRIIEIQCELENEIMSEYGYTFKDFDGDDWRQLFDDREVQEILNKYFGTKYHDKVRKSLSKYNKVVDALCDN